jgi:hypothetical protein
MVIAGPNGAGKSTLLHGIRSSAGWKNIIYLGPHRAMRRQNVQERHLLASPFIFEELLARPDSPQFEGISLIQGARDAWSHDDSANYLKHTLCQIDIDLQRAIAQRYYRQGEIQRGSLPDPWKPLRELTANLLPHIRFAGIDSTNRGNIRCLWTVHGNTDPVDLDDLSSGEKSIIQMFFPMVERSIRTLLTEVGGGEAATAARADHCVLIDEPELHLHPNLQLKVLDYFRVLASSNQTQVVVATHSPTMVESASFEELFILRPIEMVGANENQLIQVASDEERLRALRDLFGETSNLTAMQPVVIVEGVGEQDAKRVISDRKLYRALHPGFDHVTIIPGGGKSECVALLKGLRDALAVFSNQLSAVALVDRDYGKKVAAPEEHVLLLPVTMIENFLLDPDVIWEAIQSVAETSGLSSSESVAAALSKLLDDLESEEIERRAIAGLGIAFFRPQRPATDIADRATRFTTDTLKRFGVDAVKAAVEVATSEVVAVRNESRRREEFHGKEVLKRFYAAHLHRTPLSRVVFTFEAARYARKRKSTAKFFDSFFETITPSWAAKQAVPADGSSP